MHKLSRPQSLQPIPKNAERVFSGIIFDTYQWNQQLFDGTLQTFEKIKRLDSVSVLPITLNNKIILTKQEQPLMPPFIGTLGGVIERGEDPLETAKRELQEEAGLTAKTFTLFKSNQPLTKVDWAIYIFLAKDLTKVSPPNPDGGEKIELLEVSFEEFFRLSLEDNFRDKDLTLELLLAKEKNQLGKIKSLFLG